MNKKHIIERKSEQKLIDELMLKDSLSSQTIANPLVSSRLLLRIAADLQKEYVRQTDMVKADLEIQIEGLKALHKEVEDYRTIKRLLNGC